MLQNKYLKDWSRIVSYHFPHLSLPEVIGLASWSFGMVLTGSSSLTRVSEFIAKVNSDGWQWHKTRLREPARAERIWLAMAVATLWTVTVGSDEQQYLSDNLKDKVIAEKYEEPQFRLKPTNRTISCFLQGIINIIADLLCGKGISLNRLFPQSSFSVNTS
ncbi:MAG: hypothetical protein F6K47_34205 [Symploca sp. SIO2E6]|nr:hypothetical protein [Symploca sp. SIO2E6]